MKQIGFVKISLDGLVTRSSVRESLQKSDLGLRKL